jgi:hypothetical protein
VGGDEENIMTPELRERDFDYQPVRHTISPVAGTLDLARYGRGEREPWWRAFSAALWTLAGIAAWVLLAALVVKW